MKKRDLEHLLVNLAQYALDEHVRAVDRGWDPVGTCIGTTRLAVNALAAIGVRAMPVPASLLVTNAAYREGDEQGIFDDEGEKGEALRSEYAARGAYSVWIGRDMTAHDPRSFYSRDLRDGENGWDGHVVLVVRGYLLDLTSYQVNRPTLRVPPAIILPNAGKSLLAGERVSFKSDDEHDTWAEYQRINDRSYVTAPDWAELPPHSAESRKWTAEALAYDKVKPLRS